MMGIEHWSLMKKLGDLTRRQKKYLALTVASIMVLAIGVVDSTTGPQLALSAFYLIPIFIGSYFGGIAGGMFLSITSILVYLIADKILAIHYSESAIPYWNATLRLFFFGATAYLIAKRKLAEEKLSQSEEGFRLLVEGAKDYAILRLDPEGRIASWNAGAQRTYGYSKEEILGQHFRSLYAPPDSQSGGPEQDLQRAGESGEISFEGWRAKKDGSRFWAETIITQVNKIGENLGGYALLTRDITERRNAERTIRTFAQLHEVDRAILAANSSEEIAKEALQRLIQLIPCKFSTVTRFDMETGQISFLASESVESGTPPPSRMDRGDYEDLEKFKYGSAEIVKDTRSHSPLAAVLPYSSVRSYMVVPLLSQSSFIGSLNLGSDEVDFFTTEHLEIAKEIANQMALALINSDLFEHLRMAHQRLQLLNQKLLQAQEMERHHLARELHDEVGQALTALRIHLEEMNAAVREPFLSQKLSDSSELLMQVLNQIRNLSVDLRPLVLDDLGLVAALRWYVSNRSQMAGFSVHFEPDPGLGKFSPEIETVCFRLAQEALTNIVRHAKAKHVRIDLALTNDEIHLSIKDDGEGFDLQHAHHQMMQGKSFGLLGMKERVVLVGGQIEIESVPGCGTEVRARVPVQSQVKVRI
jgi:PAS domain S-box-containing protein